MLVKLCETTMQEDLRILTSIDGINNITAAPFLAEMGDWRGFRSYKQLIAFAGIDPSTHQSGTIQGVSRLSKRGNRHLRRLIWLMTFCAIRMEGPFKAYFTRRRKAFFQEGPVCDSPQTNPSHLLHAEQSDLLRRSTNCIIVDYKSSPREKMSLTIIVVKVHHKAI